METAVFGRDIFERKRLKAKVPVTCKVTGT